MRTQLSVFKTIVMGLLFTSFVTACWEKKEEAAPAEQTMEQPMDATAPAGDEAAPADEMTEQPEDTTDTPQ